MISPLRCLLVGITLGCSGLRADLPVQVRSTGLGVVVLAEPVPRPTLEAMLEATPGNTLWLRWPDATETAIDHEVARLLPDGLLKVYTMSSTSPALPPGERSGPATLVARQAAPFAPEDWTLKPGEIAEKAAMVLGYHSRYGTGKRSIDLTYYLEPEVVSDAQASEASKQASRVAAEVRPAPALRSPRTQAARLSLPVTLIAPGKGAEPAALNATRKELQTLPDSIQVPLGNYNFDLATIEALDKPNEITVARAHGLDLFVLAQARWGKDLAAVELVCYNQFTSTLTAPGQGLLLCPPDGDFAAALAAAEVLYASYEKPVIIALRAAGQSPAESASGVIAIHVLLR